MRWPAASTNFFRHIVRVDYYGVGYGDDFECAGGHQLSGHVHCRFRFRGGSYTHSETRNQLHLRRLDGRVLGYSKLQREYDKRPNCRRKVLNQFLSTDCNRTGIRVGNDYQ